MTDNNECDDCGAPEDACACICHGCSMQERYCRCDAKYEESRDMEWDDD